MNGEILLKFPQKMTKPLAISQEMREAFCSMSLLREMKQALIISVAFRQALGYFYHSLFLQGRNSMATSTLFKKTLVAAVSVTSSAIVMLSSESAFAATFNGTLINGETAIGTVDSAGYIDTPNSWSFWDFSGNAGDKVEVIVRRLVGGLDPAFGIWFGIESDVNDYSSIFEDSANTSLVASADDELPPAISGPFGDPRASFILDQTGIYTIAVASYESESSGDLPYSIAFSTTPIPTPALLPGLIGMGVAALRKRKAEVSEEASQA